MRRDNWLRTIDNASAPRRPRPCHVRIAVAIGGNGETIIKSGDFGKGYVHVLTERGFEDLLTELNEAIAA